MPHEIPFVAASPVEVRPLLVGAAVPRLTLKKADGTSIELGEELKNKPAVLVFYRGGW